jgi:hypothetical protein
MTNLTIDGKPVDYSGLPEFCRETVERYIEKGIHPGQGWSAILSNDLRAVLICDDQTVAALPQIMRWLHNHAPHGSFGNSLFIQDWMTKRQMRAA